MSNIRTLCPISPEGHYQLSSYQQLLQIVIFDLCLLIRSSSLSSLTFCCLDIFYSQSFFQMQPSNGNVSGEKDPLLTGGSGSRERSSQENYQSTTVAPAGFIHDVVPMTLAWHNIRVIREKPTVQVILDHINGKALPNEVVALMGARQVFCY